MRFPGCFRCHDDEHRTEGNRLVSMECDNCHLFIYQAHGDDAYGPVAYAPGPFEHPEGIDDMHEGSLCTECHAPEGPSE